MANRLAREKSPYLLQHAGNPVDWYPWQDEAFAKAAREDKPIFLSIGYATCHWCHVMERESFEDDAVASLLNGNFVAIKVDREERPDVDQIYMTVCQALTGHGGWPLSIVMTPERKPFYAGTYFPKVGRMGMPGLLDVLRQIANLWQTDRARLLQAGEAITQAVQPKPNVSRGTALKLPILAKAYQQLHGSFDNTWGGFGPAPKFPIPHHLTFLLRWHRRNPDSQALGMVQKTLDAMRDGGIFDQVGFGFHRYAVDAKWRVPHFEKMLYDQALLALAYGEAFQITGKPLYARVMREVFTYVLRDMTDADGAFYSAEDADSEGREGKFYVWKLEQVKSVLGRELADLYCRLYDISAEGNFEDRTNIPHLSRSPAVFAGLVGMSAEQLSAAMEEARQKLFAVRAGRIRPLKDDKILTAWNGLMIVALAKGYQALGEPAYLHAAGRAADFLLSRLHSDSGRLFRRYRHGAVAHPGYLDDYAFLIWGLLELYESALDVRYLEAAWQLHEQTLDLFWDPAEGGFFYTGRDAENLIVRNKEIHDGAVPSSNSVAALNLLRLARMTGDTRLETRLDRLFGHFSGRIADHPAAHTQFLHAVDFALGPGQEIVVAGGRGDERTQALVAVLHRKFHPHRVLLLHEPGGDGAALARLSEYVEPLAPVDGRPAAYVCENFTCRRPITDVEVLRSNID